MQNRVRARGKVEHQTRLGSQGGGNRSRLVKQLPSRKGSADQLMESGSVERKAKHTDQWQASLMQRLSSLFLNIYVSVCMHKHYKSPDAVTPLPLLKDFCRSVPRRDS